MDIKQKDLAKTRYLLLILLFCGLSSPSVYGWSETIVKTTTHDIQIVAEDGTNHTHRVTYNAIVGHHSYQTGHSARLKNGYRDTRQCHWTFWRRLEREMQGVTQNGMQRSGHWVEGKESTILDVPNLLTSEILQAREWQANFENMLGINKWDEDDSTAIKIGKTLSAFTASALFSNNINCGEARDTITASYNDVVSSLNGVLLITLIDYYSLAFKLSRHWYYINEKGKRVFALIAYPKEIDKSLFAPIVAQEIKSVLSVLSFTPKLSARGKTSATRSIISPSDQKALLEKYTQQLENPDWQRSFYQEISPAVTKNYLQQQQLLMKPLNQLKITLERFHVRRCVNASSEETIFSYNLLKNNHTSNVRLEKQYLNKDAVLAFCGEGCINDHADNTDFDRLGQAMFGIQRAQGNLKAIDLVLPGTLLRKILSVGKLDQKSRKIMTKIKSKRDEMDQIIKLVSSFPVDEKSGYRSCLREVARISEWEQENTLKARDGK
ncbi:hypothetical protein A3197_18050 [Candidatus Thiodiazotropha endoloripes]|nr:hypothetical protein A3197_18050 [Candidatus Thiodiazotropha endoloripes]